MEPDSFRVRGSTDDRQNPARRWVAGSIYRESELRRSGRGEGVMQEARSMRMDAVEARPVAELLACPSETGILLTATAQRVDFEAGQTIFSQSSLCRGLYLVVSGQLVRRTERMETRIVLGYARPGDLVELAAVLGDLHHTYSLIAQTSGSLLVLPVDSLHAAFQGYPPLRMHLLEELAREVSRAYRACSISNGIRTRKSRRSSAA